MERGAGEEGKELSRHVDAAEREGTGDCPHPHAPALAALPSFGFLTDRGLESGAGLAKGCC